jgi:hypothetical protein
MATKKTQQIRTSKEKTIVHSGEPLTLCVNNVEMRASVRDVRLSLGTVMHQAEDPLHVKHLADVYMSPQHAKAFVRILSAQLARYEEQIGRIPGEPA